MRRLVVSSQPRSRPQSSKRVRPDQAAYLRTRRVVALESGLCYECCLRPQALAKDGVTKLRRCQVCKDRNLARRTDIGVGMLCRGLCGKPSAPGRARCDDCLARHRAYMTQRRLDAGIQPRAVPQRTRRILAPRPPRVRTVSSTSAAPSQRADPAPTDGQPKVDSGPPAEVDLSKRRQAIAQLAARRAV